MRRTTVPYAGSVLVGILLVIALFLLLNSQLQPPTITLPFENVETDRPEAVTAGDRLGEAARPVIEGTEPSAQPAAASVPRFMIGVGPITEHRRAMAVVRQVVVAGFDASVTTTQVPRRFTVISAPVRLIVAQRRMSALAYLGLRPRLLRVSSRLARLQFGAFSRRSDAQALARRVRATGFSSAIVAKDGGNSYTITIGPHRRQAADVVSGLLRTRFRGVPVTVNPVN